MESEKLKIYLGDVAHKCRVMVGDKLLDGVQAVHIDADVNDDSPLTRIHLDMLAVGVEFGDARELEEKERPITLTSAPLTNADWDLMGEILDESVSDKKMDAPINIEINVTQTFEGKLDEISLKKTSDTVEKAIMDALRRRGYLN